MTRFSVVLFFCCSVITSFSQNQFSAGLKAGLVTSQIHGDGDGGYHKVGGILGVVLNNKISDNVSWQFEIDYINKGSRKNTTKNDPFFWSIRLNYMEIPLLLRIEVKKINLEIGLSYARLINQKFLDNGIVYDPRDYQLFKKYEVAGLAGVNYEINEQVYINLRASHSILPARGYVDVIPRFGIFGGSYNNVLSVAVNYTLGTKNLNE